MPDIEIDKKFERIIFECEECGAKIKIDLYLLSENCLRNSGKICSHYKLEEDKHSFLLRKIG